MPKLEEKVAVVTGAGQGLGREVARRLARDGAAVVLADIIEETVNTVAEKISSDGGEAVAAVADLAEYDQAQNVMNLALRHFGRVDILCNVAGIGPGGQMASLGKKFWETSPDQWTRDIRNNLYTCLNCCRAAVEHMMERRYGKIVNWETGAVLTGGGGGFSVYLAAKGAIYTFTKCLARELGPYNINVNAIAPGLVVADPDTRPPMAHLGPEQRQQWLDKQLNSIPLGRLGTGADIAELAAFLVSDESSWITGQSICISGGDSVR